MMPITTSVEVLQRSFPGLSPEDIAELAGLAELRRYPAGVILCHEGQSEDVFYVIAEGMVEVTKAVDETTNRVLKRLGAGEFFGEMALIHNAPRVATVRTLRPTTVLEVDKAAFETVLGRSPAMALTVVRTVGGRLRANDQLAIEELRQKNVELAEAYGQLQEQERLRSEFLTTIAHELRTPLTSAKGWLTLMRSGMVGAEALKTAIETVGDNVEAVVRLANDLLFLQEMDLIAPTDRPVEIGAVVAASVEEMRKAANENRVGLHLDIAPGLPAIQGDPDGLARVFRALLDNAVKFSPDGGDVRVRVERAGEAIKVSVADSGVGIPEEHRERVFERFYRVEKIGGRLFGGMGLGLAIARHVVAQHGGAIEFESQVGRGTTFEVSLPIRRAPSR